MAQLDRNPVAMGDPVVLTFTTNSMLSSEPDLTPLAQDFEVRGRSQSNSMVMINGVSSLRTTWEITLYPRRTGTLPIPAIQFGTDQSQALDVQVLEQPVPVAGTRYFHRIKHRATTAICAAANHRYATYVPRNAVRSTSQLEPPAD